ncbi:hypothetical protein BHM03_00002420 [Ensete ventricosum]|nr:hypothetical protein BHM03_00002420 [Ensete ventricosum]
MTRRGCICLLRFVLHCASSTFIFRQRWLRSLLVLLGQPMDSRGFSGPLEFVPRRAPRKTWRNSRRSAPAVSVQGAGSFPLRPVLLR